MESAIEGADHALFRSASPKAIELSAEQYYVG